MKEPMSGKSQEVKNLIEAVFPGTAKAIAEKRCPTCQKALGKFRDQLSAREYEISGMCQECQDSVFGGEEEE